MLCNNRDYKFSRIFLADRMQDMVLEKFDAKKQPKFTSAELLGKLEQDLAAEISQCSAGKFHYIEVGFVD